ncbi:hypothetical protein A4R43_33425 [Amycolatopsis albispora]|uniref:Uncharacterized protein n=1 Tax=Amycolatopsis albispora TaxID=1804986 RepID=A0A344LFB5_9PSEU|nr:hypothetical protein A4R43_33425 [Amycolatopsis albispora]
MAIVGLFALTWVGDANFADLNDALNSSPDLKGDEQWLKLYLRQGAIIALALSAVPPVLWTLGSLRDRKSIKRRGGLMKKSLSAGNTTPTRNLITGIAGAALLYHVVSLLLFTDGGKHLDQLGAGPWLLVVGTALSVVGAAIGPRVPGRR